MKKLVIAMMFVGLLLSSNLVGIAIAEDIDLSTSTSVITNPNEMTIYNFRFKGLSYWADFQWDDFHNEFRIKKYGNLEHTTEEIKEGVWTIGVDDSEYAFDQLVRTWATIPWYWGEGGHYDFLHFTSYIGQDAVFTFNILIHGNDEAVGSAAIDGYNYNTQQWELITSYALSEGPAMTIIVRNAQDYVENGIINLRVKWIDGWNWQDFYVHGIWR